MSEFDITRGPSVLSAIQELVESNNAITEIEFFEPGPVVPLQQRLVLTDQQNTIVERALQLRATSGFSFWDTVLASSIELGREAAPLLLEARFHNTAVLSQVRLPANQCSIENLQEQCLRSLSSGRRLAVRSRVTLQNGDIAHIPMIDFHCRVSVKSEGLIEAAIRTLAAEPGYIVESGESYHFYGLRLLSTAELPRFLGNALLLSPIVDRAWIAHQLIEGSCALRISPKTQEDHGPIVRRKIP